MPVRQMLLLVMVLPQPAAVDPMLAVLRMLQVTVVPEVARMPAETRVTVQAPAETVLQVARVTVAMVPKVQPATEPKVRAALASAEVVQPVQLAQAEPAMVLLAMPVTVRQPTAQKAAAATAVMVL